MTQPAALIQQYVNKYKNNSLVKLSRQGSWYFNFLTLWKCCQQNNLHCNESARRYPLAYGHDTFTAAKVEGDPLRSSGSKHFHLPRASHQDQNQRENLCEGCNDAQAH